MLRIRRTKKSKRGVTLVELLVAMTLTAIFAGSCIMLMLPIEKIYTHTNDLSRAQVLADTIVDELRAECSNTYISGVGDAWISNSGAAGMSGASPVGRGPVLVIRRNQDYCETIASNYVITVNELQRVAGTNDVPAPNAVTSRAIYRMFPQGSSGAGSPDTGADFVHFGYFNVGETSISGVTYTYPHVELKEGSWTGYYDFTSPFTSATYGVFTVELTFSDLTCDSSGVPAFVMCMVTINKPGVGVVYTRNAVLCFS
ncbi:MAG: prepilin-type N-terminal cleavage/methylation domain-containing protein [Saccharofermentans sp.]|nr:prepilin-type N-terminal cleavage/methylation domain-containing protein [Saccharofermentans sp.]